MQRIVYVHRVDRRVAEIGTVAQVKRPDAGGVVHVARHRRQVADLARSVARAGAVGRAAVPGHADQADIDFVGVSRRDVRQAHESCNAGETG